MFNSFELYLTPSATQFVSEVFVAYSNTTQEKVILSLALYFLHFFSCTSCQGTRKRE